MADDGDAVPRAGWFGTTWHSPVNEDMPHVATPVGESCIYCPQPIADGDRGLTIPHWYEPGKWQMTAVHLGCWMDHVVWPAKRHVGDDL